MNFILQYCSIVDVVPHLCPLTGEGNHIFVVSPPKSEHLPTPMNNCYVISPWYLMVFTIQSNLSYPGALGLGGA